MTHAQEREDVALVRELAQAMWYSKPRAIYWDQLGADYQGWLMRDAAAAIKFLAPYRAAETQAAVAAAVLAEREAAAELGASVYIDLIGGGAVPCTCGNGRIPTTSYKRATDAYAAAIRARSEARS